MRIMLTFRKFHHAYMHGIIAGNHVYLQVFFFFAWNHAGNLCLESCLSSEQSYLGIMLTIKNFPTNLQEILLGIIFTFSNFRSHAYIQEIVVRSHAYLLEIIVLNHAYFQKITETANTYLQKIIVRNSACTFRDI